MLFTEEIGELNKNLEQAKTTKGHNYLLCTGCLILSFRNTRYFARNTQYFKFKV